MSVSDDVDNHRQVLPAGVLGAMPLRLTVPTTPDFDVQTFVKTIPHMEGALHACALWQELSATATFREASAVGHGVEVGRVYELIRYQAAVGEALAMACCSGVEAALWSHQRAPAKAAVEPDGMARAEMAHRAVAELQSHFLIGAGHGLINITARALALDDRLRLMLLDNVGSGFAVGRTDRRDFLSVNQDTARELRKVARRAQSSSFTDVVDPVSKLAIDSAWQAMVESRGEHFHRIRAQSFGVAGLSAKSPWTFGEGFRSMDVGWPSAYSETQGLADELTRVNQDALGVLATAMLGFFEASNVLLNEVCSP